MILKDRIIHESLRLFSTNGYCSTSISDILDAAHTSKGGFYNHFASKEDLFLIVLAEAQSIWREQTLAGLDEIESPVEKVIQILRNYKDRYLIDTVNFPGGCVFVTFSVELDDQNPRLAAEVNKGFQGFKAMIGRFLDEGKERGELPEDVDTEELTELLFAGMLGASVAHGVSKSTEVLNRSIYALINYVEKLIVFHFRASETNQG